MVNRKFHGLCVYNVVESSVHLSQATSICCASYSMYCGYHIPHTRDCVRQHFDLLVWWATTQQHADPPKKSYGLLPNTIFRKQILHQVQPIQSNGINLVEIELCNQQFQHTSQTELVVQNDPPLPQKSNNRL